jgi:hypothetical protein
MPNGMAKNLFANNLKSILRMFIGDLNRSLNVVEAEEKEPLSMNELLD